MGAKNGKEGVDLYLKWKNFYIVLCGKDMHVMSGPKVF
jgi:hypothetical protein